MDFSNTTSKENIRSKIRHALTVEDAGKFTKIDTCTQLYDTDLSLQDFFLKNYRDAGGKYFFCTKENFLDKLELQITNITKVLKDHNFCTILNTYPALNQEFVKRNIPCKNCLDFNLEADLVIAYSHILVANNGSLMFSQKHSLYPTIKNLAKTVFVIASATHIVPDLKTAMEIQQKMNNEKMYGSSEFIIPTKKDSILEYTKTDPLFALFLIF